MAELEAENSNARVFYLCAICTTAAVAHFLSIHWE